jgi:hypothetical protein
MGIHHFRFLKMKVKAITLSAIISVLLSTPCYAEPPGYQITMMSILSALIIIFGIIGGYVVKAILFYARIESIKNWQIFLATTILAGILVVSLLAT